MFTLILTLATILTALHLRRIMNIEERGVGDVSDEVNNGAAWNLWTSLVDRYGLPLGQFCISSLYGLYIRFTVLNMIIFLLKYIPTGVYMYRCIKSIYVTSRERLKQRQIELEDIQLQIQIVNTKLCVRDAEYIERAEQRRRSAQRFMRVRARVRGLIAADEGLRRALHAACAADPGPYDATRMQQDREDSELIVELLKELKYDQEGVPDRQPEKMDCGEHAQSDHDTPENSVYSSLSDGDMRQDCRVKIVKVTNVYKVAYLKHYIKQKRLRRANKQALLKKKMENIKKLLDDWQKTLNMVINNKLTILNDSHGLDVASQEAMGDYSKPAPRPDSSDSESDLRNSTNDMPYDEYSLNWTQTPYKSYGYGNYEDISDSAGTREFYDTQDLCESRYSNMMQCQCRSTNIMSILEETNSDIAIEELKSETQDAGECHDLVVL